MVWAVALGMLLLVVWRAHRGRVRASRARRIHADPAAAGVGGEGHRVCRPGRDRHPGRRWAPGAPSQSSRGMTAKVMDLPAGQWIVAAIGLGVIVYGVAVIVRHGWQEEFAEDLQTEGKLGWSGAGYLLLGKVGHFAKGVVLIGRRRADLLRRDHPRGRRSPAGSTRRCRRSSSSRSVPTCCSRSASASPATGCSPWRRLDTSTGEPVRGRHRFHGEIAGVGSSSGVRVVVGHWRESPLGTFADVMLAEPDGTRVLLAPERGRRRLRLDHLSLRPGGDRPGECRDRRVVSGHASWHVVGAGPRSHLPRGASPGVGLAAPAGAQPAGHSAVVGPADRPGGPGRAARRTNAGTGGQRAPRVLRRHRPPSHHRAGWILAGRRPGRLGAGVA